MKYRFVVVSAAMLLPHAVTGAGPDVVVGILDNGYEYARTPTIAALTVATTSCNDGDLPLAWKQLPDNRHPVITMNMYRLRDSRFEQIGQSWVKHGFFAAEENLCRLGCQPVSTGQALGVGCSDPYAASLNEGPNLASRSEINPFTGHFNGDSANDHSRHAHPLGIEHGLQVLHSDLNTPNSRYFIEAQYIAPDDAAAGNGGNNAAYREVAVVDLGGEWVLQNRGETVMRAPALKAWEGALVSENDDQPRDGKIIVASKASGLGAGRHRYEYFVYNMNSERGLSSFSVRVGDASLSNIGFSAVQSHGEAWSNAAWQSRREPGVVFWSVPAHEQDSNANAIRWGTGYSFWFESDREPTTGIAQLSRFRGSADRDFELAVTAPSGP